MSQHEPDQLPPHGPPRKTARTYAAESVTGFAAGFLATTAGVLFVVLLDVRMLVRVAVGALFVVAVIALALSFRRGTTRRVWVAGVLGGVGLAALLVGGCFALIEAFNRSYE
jgi:hypothetical protein